MNCQWILDICRLEVPENFLAGGGGDQTINQLRIGGAFDQHVFLQAADGFPGESACKWKDEVVNLAGGDVVFVDSLACYQQQSRHRVTGLQIAAGKRSVGGNEVDVHVQAPCLEQFVQ